MQQIMEKMKSLLKINKYNIEKSFQDMLDAGAISYSYFVIFNVTQAIKDKSLRLALDWLEWKCKMSTAPSIPRRSPIQVLTWLNVA